MTLTFNLLPADGNNDVLISQYQFLKFFSHDIFLSPILPLSPIFVKLCVSHVGVNAPDIPISFF